MNVVVYCKTCGKKVCPVCHKTYFRSHHLQVEGEIQTTISQSVKNDNDRISRKI